MPLTDVRKAIHCYWDGLFWTNGHGCWETLREALWCAVHVPQYSSAVHLEVAHSLTTDSAIMAIRRMIARRGHQKEIHSDNGTNLRGADKELRASLASLDQDKLKAELTAKAIKWVFNPPAAPHMGGSWERLVRSVKTAIRAILKKQAPCDEVLLTVFAEAECLVNSHPLSHVSLDADDDESLTPAHFLIGSSSAAQPPGAFSADDLCGRKQWRKAQHLADHFWQRWLKEYLPTLTRRTKWHQRTTPVKKGDIVIIVDNTLPRGSWPKGIVTATYPGADNIVRVADVKTATGVFRRPVTKLCVLDVSP